MTRSKLASYGVAALAAITPALALAQGIDTNNLRPVINNILNVFNSIILPVLVAIAVIYVIIAAFQFAISGADEEKRTSARQKIVWGIVGIVIIFAIYAIIGLIVTSLTGINAGGGSNLPDPQGIQF